MFDARAFLVRERVGVFKLTDTFDIFDAASGRPLGIAHENVSGGMKALRLLVNKRFLPTSVEVAPTPEAPPHLVIRRGFTFLRSRLEVFVAGGRPIGRFVSKIFSLGGGFFVEDADGRPFAEVKGDWKGWNFRFEGADGRLLGTVGRKWGGLAKELFTTADSYVIALEPTVVGVPHAAELLLAAGLAIDIVFKER